MDIAIVGNAEDKFTPATATLARQRIRELVSDPAVQTVISGGCHLGGVDIWAEEIARELGKQVLIFLPESRSWLGGYKERNQRIANRAELVHVIVAATYPAHYAGRRFNHCYHCHTTNHVKSGGCWTGWKAKTRGAAATWHIIG